MFFGNRAGQTAAPQQYVGYMPQRQPRPMNPQIAVDFITVITAMEISEQDKDAYASAASSLCGTMHAWLERKNAEAHAEMVMNQSSKVSFSATLVGLNPLVSGFSLYINCDNMQTIKALTCPDGKIEVSRILLKSAVISVNGPSVKVTVDAPFKPVPMPFSKLLRLRKVGNGKYISGYTDGLPNVTTWPMIENIAISGQQGSGKSTTARSFVAQLALDNVAFLVCDPHFNAPDVNGKTDSLGKSLMGLQKSMIGGRVMQTREEIMYSLDWVYNLVEKRVNTKRNNGETIDTRICWVMDEFFNVFLLSSNEEKAEIKRKLTVILSEGRKFKVNCVMVAHTWLAEALGNSTIIRQLFNTRICHNSEAGTARLLLGTGDAAKDVVDEVSSLQKGEAGVKRGDGKMGICMFPNTTPEDIDAVSELSHPNLSKLELPFSIPVVTTQQQKLSNRAKLNDDIDARIELGEEYYDPDEKILALYKTGMGNTDIVQQVYGGKGGEKFPKYSKHINEVVVAELRRLEELVAQLQSQVRGKAGM